ncbi:MAG: UDP-N-acetylmuramate--L-alanine ligase [Ruminococcaceae bacterium]|nr:UDP-N-acetylmuramate--L-alanine ligase [Oscillospiraceae bacterium]
MNINELKPNSNLYFLGIGGISMSAIAMMLSGKGFKVCGYDKTKSDVTDKLEKFGIAVFDDFNVSQIVNCDAIIFSAAFGPDHPIMQEVLKTGKTLYSRAEILGALALLYKNSVAIAGTHGKSTTSGMLGHILINAVGCDPTVVVGAVMRDVGSTYRIGTDENFIFEACEYKDSFLSFFPKIAVVLNISLDHTDYFTGIEHMRNSFTQFMNNGGEDGYAIYNLDCENCILASRDNIVKNITFSALGNKKADFYANNVCMNCGFASFDVYKNNQFYISVKLSAPGEHNIANALAAIAVCDLCGIAKDDIVKGLFSYVGVGRRFEYKGSFCGADVYDDYAHHPDEIKVTLAAAKDIAKGRVVTVFQPHNYSRLRDLFDDFTQSFNDTDLLILCPLYAARDGCGTEVSSELLAKRIDGSVYLETFDEIKEYLKQELSQGDVLMIMGAGDIAKLANSI